MDILTKKIEGLYFELTGQNLSQLIEKELISEDPEGAVTMSQEEFFGAENIEKNEEDIRGNFWINNVQKRWDKISEKEKNSYGPGGQGFKLFAAKLDSQREYLKKIGIIIPVDVFYVLLGDDRIYYPQSTKEIGIFNKRIVMPVGPSKKNINLGPKENFNSWILKIKDNFNRLVSQTAETQMRKKMAEWQVKKVKKMGQIIVDVFTKNPVIPPEISKIQTSHQAINFIEKEIQTEARVKKLLGILVEVTQKYLKPENLKDFYDYVSNSGFQAPKFMKNIPALVAEKLATKKKQLENEKMDLQKIKLADGQELIGKLIGEIRIKLAGENQ